MTDYKLKKTAEKCTHDYAEKQCLKCGEIFCYSCCGGTNVDQGGKYESDYMTCPHCGFDYYDNI